MKKPLYRFLTTMAAVKSLSVLRTMEAWSVYLIRTATNVKLPIGLPTTGGLVEGLSQEDFFKGRSMLRNRELMRVFKDVELVEELGSGMQRILEAYDRSVFEITPGFIVVTFPYANDFERSVSGDTGKNERSVSEAELTKLRPILEYLESHDTITPQEARKLTGKSAATTRRYLTLLCNNNLLEPTGKTSATVYKVIR